MSQPQAPYKRSSPADITNLTCPVHNETLEKIAIKQGDTVLGWLLVCPLGEWGSRKKEECDFFLDTDSEGNPILDPELTIQGLFQYAGLELGKDRVADVIECWVNERLAMRQLHQRNNKQAAYIKRWDKLLALCLRMTALIDQEAGLFSPKVRELTIEFDQLQKLAADELQEALKL